jgi:hypothetical protein
VEVGDRRALDAVPATVIVSGRPSAPIAIVTVLPAPRSSSVMSPAALVMKLRSGWPVTAWDCSRLSVVP